MRAPNGMNRLSRLAGLAALCVLILWTAHGALSRPLRKAGFWPPCDYGIIYDSSWRVIQRGGYDSDLLFPYPPSAVAVMATTIGPPVELASVVWITLCMVSTVGTVALGSSLVGLKQHPWRWPLALAAFALASHFVIWDLRAGNTNMVYCFLLVASLAALNQKRDLLAGLCLAASVALKLYPILAMFYLLWRGQWRAFFATIACLAIFFLGLPAVVFGPSGLLEVYVSWVEHLRQIAARIDGMDHSILISLTHTLRHQLGVDSPLVIWLVRGLSMMWLAAVGGVLWSAKGGRASRPQGWDLAADGGMLVLATVVISPYLEPYHPVVALLPMLALTARAADWRDAASRSIAKVAIAGLLGGWLARTCSGSLGLGDHGLAGLGIYVQMLFAALSLIIIRIQDARLQQASAQAPQRLRLAA